MHEKTHYVNLIESNISKNPVIIIDEKTHVDMCEVSGYCELVDTYQERHYIKPFELLNKSMVLDIDENFTLNEIDRDKIENNIKENKNTFEYDVKNYSKYVFLLEQLENCNKTPEKVIE